MDPHLPSIYPSHVSINLPLTWILWVYVFFFIINIQGLVPWPLSPPILAAVPPKPAWAGPHLGLAARKIVLNLLDLRPESRCRAASVEKIAWTSWKRAAILKKRNRLKVVKQTRIFKITKNIKKHGFIIEKSGRKNGKVHQGTANSLHRSMANWLDFQRWTSNMSCLARPGSYPSSGNKSNRSASEHRESEFTRTYSLKPLKESHRASGV